MDYNFHNTKFFWGKEVQRGKMIWPDEQVIRFIKKNVKIEDGEILDFGCGAGRNAIALAQEGYDVVAMDYNTEGLDIIKERLEGTDINIKCVVNNEIQVPLKEESINAIVADGSLFFYTEEVLIQLLNNLKKCLKQEGLFWADWRSKEDSMYGQGEEIAKNLFVLGDGAGRKGCNYYFADKEEIQALYSKVGFEIVSIDSFSYTVNNGTIKNSWWHVVARK